MNKDIYERKEFEEEKEALTREENAITTEQTRVRKTEEKKITNKDEDGEANGDVESTEFTDAGDFGDEQLPAGDIKTDKRVWDYSAEKRKENDLPKKVKNFIAGL